MNTSPGDNLKGTLLRHLTALFLVTELLVFLGIALLVPLDPGFINLSPQSEGIIVGGIMVSVQTIILSLFQSEATKQAARAAQQSHDAGVAAGLATPGTPTTTTVTTPAGATTVTEPAGAPAPAYQVFTCPVDGLGYATQQELDQHTAQMHP